MGYLLLITAMNGEEFTVCAPHPLSTSCSDDSFLRMMALMPCVLPDELDTTAQMLAENIGSMPTLADLGFDITKGLNQE